MLVLFFLLIIVACLIILIYSKFSSRSESFLGGKTELVFLDNTTGKIIGKEEILNRVEDAKEKIKKSIRKWDKDEYLDNNRRRVPIGLQN